MAIVLAPLALWFFFAFLLTSRDYVRSRSVPLLVLGAVFQPVICAMIFAFGLVLVDRLTVSIRSIVKTRRDQRKTWLVEKKARSRPAEVGYGKIKRFKTLLKNSMPEYR